jgi:Fe-S cluster assembly iron-binding protein IscA
MNLRILTGQALSWPFRGNRLVNEKWTSGLSTRGGSAIRKGEQMLNLTETAAAHLARLQKKPQLYPDKVIRFVIEDGSIQMIPDQEREGDIVFRDEGETVLVFDKTVSTQLKDLTLDLTKRMGSSQLVLKPSSE